jgi:hypothetical protein
MKRGKNRVMAIVGLIDMCCATSDHGLGNLCGLAGNVARVRGAYSVALRINPSDTVAQQRVKWLRQRK